MIKGRIAAFAFMFAIVYIGICVLIAAVPTLLAFITWDLSMFSPDWDAMFLLLRVNVLFSAFVATLFVISIEGKQFAIDFNEWMNKK
jgi:hypothetical protein